MPGESKKQRNAKQMIRQQRVRDNARLRRRPDRDDLARVLLWQMIEVARQEDNSNIALGKVRDVIVELLERQGFNVFESEDVFEELAKVIRTVSFPSVQSGIWKPTSWPSFNTLFANAVQFQWSFSPHYS